MTNTTNTNTNATIVTNYNHNHDCPFEAYITNLGKYNEGDLVGEWLKMPCTEEEIENVLKRIGINENYEEYFITDYDVYVDNLYSCLGEYENLESLNELAQNIDNLDAWDFDKLQAILEIESVNGIDDINDIIENIDDYMLDSSINNDYDLGYYYAIECGSLNIPSYLENYIDFEAYGRDLTFELDGNFTSYGWLERC